MKNITISDLSLRFDWGTMELIAEVTGKDASNPIEDITDFTDRAVHILYGGMARHDERSEVPITHTLASCRKIIKDFTPGEVGQMLTAFFGVMKIDADESKVTGSAEKKR